MFSFSITCCQASSERKLRYGMRNLYVSRSSFFFFSSRRRHTRFDCDWSSDVCSSDLALAHPQIVLEVEYADRFVDIVGERFDAAVRIGRLADSRLVALRLGGHQRILGAAPAYLQAHGTPVHPEDLAAHRCLGFTGLQSFPQ